MDIWYDYRLIMDNAGGCHLFVRDFGGPQLHGVEPTMYCFYSNDRAEITRALAEIMTSPDGVDLTDWSGWGDIDDPDAHLKELEAIIAERNGGAVLVADGSIYA